jgi:GntR family transcriptional regulator, transcriptional repressor for pyruvate dehydrogenase complex
MPLKPVEKILVSDGILDQIRGMIHSGEFLPEQRLPSEMKMAGNLSVSRSSLREALNALVHLGYLQRRNRGIYVAPRRHWQTSLSFHFLRSPEDQSIAEMIEVRKIVETELCALAAKRADAEDIEVLRESLEQMKTEVHDPDAFISSNQHFHLGIASAAKNTILKDFIEKIRDLLRNNIATVIQRSTISRRSLGYHQKIFEAIRDGDAARARRAMVEHITDIEKAFLKILYRPAPTSPGERKSASMKGKGSSFSRKG